MRGLVWFKKDLRISDHPALHKASNQCEDGIAAIYIIDDNMWEKNSISLYQREFILQSLKQLQHDLAEHDIPLIIEKIPQTKKIPACLLTWMEKISAHKLFFNRELEINESRRDQEATLFLQQKNKLVEQFDEQLILPFTQVRTGQGDYFKVFTAFKRQWLKIFVETNTVKLLSKPKIKNKIQIKGNFSDIITPPKIDLSLWTSGERAANKLLRTFIKERLFLYDRQRDFSAITGTSRLSPYLATGMISAKTCFLTALTANAHELASGNKGAVTWMSELIWREFYRHILIAAPRVCMNKAYKEATEKLPWNYRADLLTAWQQGQTGFPLVDAAMRQLNTTGWMHNRLRMVAAMFLSKNLFLDWRLGEDYFARHLIDIDFASNNGGWQWSASTGTDAVPYFRIFNPTTQSKRFDPEGKFIRQYCPELKDCTAKSIHAPHQYQPALAKKAGYPEPIIDYAESRKRVIAAFRQLA